MSHKIIKPEGIELIEYLNFDLVKQISKPSKMAY